MHHGLSGHGYHEANEALRPSPHLCQLFIGVVQAVDEVHGLLTTAVVAVLRGKREREEGGSMREIRKGKESKIQADQQPS